MDADFDFAERDDEERGGHLAIDRAAGHTYSLQADNRLSALIKGVTCGTTLKDIVEDLRGQGFVPAHINWMTNRRKKHPIPLILMQVPQE